MGSQAMEDFLIALQCWPGCEAMGNTFETRNLFIESDACVQSMHIVAIDNIMHTFIFITIGAGAGAVVTPKILPIYLQFIFEK
jgi:hypothetical protein